MTDQHVTVVAPVARTVVVPHAPTRTVVVTTGQPGPQGPAGDSVAVEMPMLTPIATWTLTVPPAMGRTPAVSVYVAGELVDADVHATSSTVTVTFPSPTAGVAVLT